MIKTIQLLEIRELHNKILDKIWFIHTYEKYKSLKQY